MKSVLIDLLYYVISNTKVFGEVNLLNPLYYVHFHRTYTYPWFIEGMTKGVGEAHKIITLKNQLRFSR